MSVQGDFLAAVHATAVVAGELEDVLQQLERVDTAELRRELAALRLRAASAELEESCCRAAYLAGEVWQPVEAKQVPVDVRERLWAAAEVVMRSVAAGDTEPEAAVKSLRDLLCATNRWDWMAELLPNLLDGLTEDDLLEVLFEEAMEDTTKAHELVAWLKGGGVQALVREVTALPVADADGYRWEVERWDRPAAVFTERKDAGDWAGPRGGQLRRVEPRLTYGDAIRREIDRRPVQTGGSWVGGDRQVIHDGTSIEPHPERKDVVVLREGGEVENIPVGGWNDVE